MCQSLCQLIWKICTSSLKMGQYCLICTQCTLCAHRDQIFFTFGHFKARPSDLRPEMKYGANDLNILGYQNLYQHLLQLFNYGQKSLVHTSCSRCAQLASFWWNCKQKIYTFYRKSFFTTRTLPQPIDQGHASILPSACTRGKMHAGPSLFGRRITDLDNS